jgi:hypothetical protein
MWIQQDLFVYEYKKSNELCVFSYSITSQRRYKIEWSDSRCLFIQFYGYLVQPSIIPRPVVCEGIVPSHESNAELVRVLIRIVCRHTEKLRQMKDRNALILSQGFV